MLTQIKDYFQQSFSAYMHCVTVHLFLSVLAVAAAALIGIPAGAACAKNEKMARLLTGSFNVLRIIPSLALLVIVMPVLGTGFLPALVALTVLAVPIVLIHTALGFQQVSASILEAAVGMGMNRRQLVWKIQFPLAFPLILSGIRTASVEVIASATLAAYIGAGGLGELIMKGLGLMRTDFLLIGGVSVAVLSVGAELVFTALEKRWTRYTLH